VRCVAVPLWAPRRSRPCRCPAPRTGSPAGGRRIGPVLQSAAARPAAGPPGSAVAEGRPCPWSVRRGGSRACEA
jgi:hypothetical protein